MLKRFYLEKKCTKAYVSEVQRNITCSASILVDYIKMLHPLKNEHTKKKEKEKKTTFHTE